MKTDENIENIYELVKMQLVVMRRAIYRTGNFVLNSRSILKVTKPKNSAGWQKEEKTKLLNKILMAVPFKEDNLLRLRMTGTPSLKTRGWQRSCINAPGVVQQGLRESRPMHVTQYC